MALLNAALPRQLSERLAQLSASANLDSGVIDVPVEIMIEMPIEDLELMGLDAQLIFSQPFHGPGRFGHTVTGSRALQLLLAQLLRGGLLENALAEFMNDVINSSFLDAEPEFIPADQHDIDNLEIIPMTAEHLGNQSISEDMKMCAICRDQFEEGLRVMRLPCRHLFCEECLRPWLEKSRTCPLCREEIINILPGGEKQRHKALQAPRVLMSERSQQQTTARSTPLRNTIGRPASMPTPSHPAHVRQHIAPYMPAPPVPPPEREQVDPNSPVWSLPGWTIPNPYDSPQPMRRTNSMYVPGAHNHQWQPAGNLSNPGATASMVHDRAYVPHNSVPRTYHYDHYDYQRTNRPVFPAHHSQSNYYSQTPLQTANYNAHTEQTYHAQPYFAQYPTQAPHAQYPGHRHHTYY